MVVAVEGGGGGWRLVAVVVLGGGDGNDAKKLTCHSYILFVGALYISWSLSFHVLNSILLLILRFDCYGTGSYWTFLCNKIE